MKVYTRFIYNKKKKKRKIKKTKQTLNASTKESRKTGGVCRCLQRLALTFLNKRVFTISKEYGPISL